MIRQAQQADNPLKMLITFRKMKEYGAHMLEDFFSACEGSQVIVYHPGIAIGYFAAGTTRHSGSAGLSFPLALHPPANLGHPLWQSESQPDRQPLKPQELLQSTSRMTSKSTIQSFWRKKFGQLPAHFGSPDERHTDARHPAVDLVQ